MNNEGMRLADGVLHRIVQILQEGIIMGVDVSDLMRQIRLEASTTDAGELVLTTAYSQQVSKSFEKYAADAAQIKEKQGGAG